MSAVLMDNTRLTVRSGSKHRNTLERYLKCNTNVLTVRNPILTFYVCRQSRVEDFLPQGLLLRPILFHAASTWCPTHARASA